jgi:hypothetical protein
MQIRATQTRRRDSCFAGWPFNPEDPPASWQRRRGRANSLPGPSLAFALNGLPTAIARGTVRAMGKESAGRHFKTLFLQ